MRCIQVFQPEFVYGLSGWDESGRYLALMGKSDSMGKGGRMDVVLAEEFGTIAIQLGINTFFPLFSIPCEILLKNT